MNKHGGSDLIFNYSLLHFGGKLLVFDLVLKSSSNVESWWLLLYLTYKAFIYSIIPNLKNEMV
jgi:hypothetical protein